MRKWDPQCLCEAEVAFQCSLLLSDTAFGVSESLRQDRWKSGVPSRRGVVVPAAEEKWGNAVLMVNQDHVCN